MFIEAIRAIKPGEELTYDYGTLANTRAAEENLGLPLRLEKCTQAIAKVKR